MTRSLHPKGLNFILDVITVSGVVPCGSSKMSPCRFIRVTDEGSFLEIAQYGPYTISPCMFPLLQNDLNFIFYLHTGYELLHPQS